MSDVQVHISLHLSLAGMFHIEAEAGPVCCCPLEQQGGATYAVLNWKKTSCSNTNMGD